MTFKERYEKFKKSAVEFWNENKMTIIAAGGFIAGAFITYKIMKNDGVVKTSPVTIPQPVTEDPGPWDEESMRENWDWVCELASNMEMAPGEEYHIYGSDFDVQGVSIGDNYVSHMVYGDDAYPDDVEAYKEMYDPNEEDDNEDEEENEEETDTDDEFEITVNEEDPAVKDIARKFAALVNCNAVSIKRAED